MRCPKCGYLSFDMLESCVKCGKNIGDAATELEGTVASVPPPSFLRVAGQEASSETLEESVDVGTEEPLDLGAEGEEETMDFTLDDESEAEEVEMDLGDVGEEEVPEIDLGEEDAGEEALPEIDLGDEGETAEAEAGFDLGGEEETVEEPEAEEEIGISDLAPEEEAEFQPEEPSEEVYEEPEAEDESAVGGEGLQDLEVDGIDLESTPGAPDTDKIMPSVKTGTALDDFEIDLGDLMTSKDD